MKRFCVKWYPRDCIGDCDPSIGYVEAENLRDAWEKSKIYDYYGDVIEVYMED